jgi:hypothetical protein
MVTTRTYFARASCPDLSTRPRAVERDAAEGSGHQLPHDLEQGDENRWWRSDFFSMNPAHDGEIIRFCRNNGGSTAPKQDHGAAYTVVNRIRHSAVAVNLLGKLRFHNQKSSRKLN